MISYKQDKDQSTLTYVPLREVRDWCWEHLPNAKLYQVGEDVVIESDDVDITLFRIRFP